MGGQLKSFTLQSKAELGELWVAFPNEYENDRTSPFHFLDADYENLFEQKKAKCRNAKLPIETFFQNDGSYNFSTTWNEIPTQRSQLTFYTLCFPEYAVPDEIIISDTYFSEKLFNKSIYRDDEKKRYIVYLECRSRAGVFNFKLNAKFHKDESNFNQSQFRDSQTINFYERPLDENWHYLLPNKEIEKVSHFFTERINDSEKAQPYALVMKGGGIKGLAYVGAYEELEKHGYDFDWFCGTSAGAITAALLASGCSTKKLKDTLSDTEFGDFLDAKFYELPFNLLIHRGFYKADTLTDWLDKQLAEQLKSPFQVEMKLLPKRLSVYATRRGKKALVFDSKFNKDRYVSFVVRCSMAIPFVFTPQSDNGLRVWDGGVQNNYPVSLLLEDNPDTKFIGLYLGSEIYEGKKKHPSIIKELLSIWTEANDDEALEKYKEQTIIIDPRPISTLDFKLSTEEKDFLLKVGKASALKFLAKEKKVDTEVANFAENEANKAREIVTNSRTQRKRKRKLVYGLGFFGIICSVIVYIFLSKCYCLGAKDIGAIGTPASTDGPKIVAISTKKYEIPIGRKSAPVGTKVEEWDLPHRDSIWDARNANLQHFKGIAGLLNPSFNDCPYVYGWTLLGSYNQASPTNPNDPKIDPEAELIFEFDSPAKVEELEIITGAWGIKELDVWVGNTIEELVNLPSSGVATTNCKFDTNTTMPILIEYSSCWYKLPKPLLGRYLKVKVRQTYQTDGEFWLYRIYPEANGKRLTP